MYNISIIITYYNGQKTLQNTAESVINSLRNTSLNYEILIINDQPGADLSYVSKINNHIKVVNNKQNLGIAPSRNVGKKLSKYEYLYFIDQDDWVAPQFFVKVEECIKNKYDAIIFNYNTVEGKKIKKYNNIMFKLLLKYCIDDKFLMKYDNFFRTIGQIVFRKNMLDNFIVTDTMGSDDKFVFMQILSKKEEYKIKYIDKNLFFYRISETNYSKKTDFAKSSYECLNIYKLNHPYISEYEKYIYYKPVFVKIKGKIMRVLTKNFITI